MSVVPDEGLEMSEARVWRKSSYSDGRGGNCVEVAELPCGAALRDSKHPAKGRLPFASSEWTAFLHSARDSRR
nr:DUF397 domain-containing protein [Nocardiopsis valliformis]